MNDLSFVGPLIRLHRLKNNWSQATLCSGICAVSYLSKIEKGRVLPNEELLKDLVSRLGLVWHTDKKDRELCERIYEAIFAWDNAQLQELLMQLNFYLEQSKISIFHLDLIVAKAYLSNDCKLIPDEMIDLLTGRQRCLYAILQGEHDLAFHCYPCALSAYCVAEEAYCKGNYTYALEYLNTAYEKASQNGFVYIMMICQSCMANCYSDIGNMEAMQRHSFIARRIAQALGDSNILNTIDYNLAATELEHGNVSKAYAYFSALDDHSVMSLHKLAICCELMDKTDEALSALDRAVSNECADSMELEMCDLVRYRIVHRDYLQDATYCNKLMTLFNAIETRRHHGYARFHLPWVLEYLKTNRKYKEAYELMLSFTK